MTTLLLGNGGPVPNYTTPTQVDCELTLAGMGTPTPWWGMRCGEIVVDPPVDPAASGGGGASPATHWSRLGKGSGGGGDDSGGGGEGGDPSAEVITGGDGGEWLSPCESSGGGPEVVLISSEVATGALASFSKLVGGLTAGLHSLPGVSVVTWTIPADMNVF